MEVMPIGKAEVLRSGKDIALLTLGHTALDGAAAADRAVEQGVSVCHIDLRWAKPLDSEMLAWVGQNFKHVVTVEDGVINGGVGSAVADWLSDNGYACHITRLGIGDKFVTHGSIKELKALCGYDTEGILRALLER